MDDTSRQGTVPNLNMVSRTARPAQGGSRAAGPAGTIGTLSAVYQWGDPHAEFLQGQQSDR
jgi:hypothetical protein